MHLYQGEYLVMAFCRLLNLIAEDASIEDTIYYLAKAHERGIIDIDTFLKVCWLWCCWFGV